MDTCQSSSRNAGCTSRRLVRSACLLAPPRRFLTLCATPSATQIEGIFRVSGSSKRINELQAIFDSPPRYGKDLDWQGYSVHDAASVLRRYLNQMPVSLRL
jgi:hypothetical protein